MRLGKASNTPRNPGLSREPYIDIILYAFLMLTTSKIYIKWCHDWSHNNPHRETKLFFIGPRGTGKTTWVKSHYPEAIYIDLLDAQIRNQLTAEPGRLKKYIPDSYHGWIILDEIQLIPDLLNEVHRQIFAGKNKFILTGSSARSLRRKGVNLLGGRALTRTFHPLTAVELGEKFDIVKSLHYGHLPLAILGEEPTAYLQSFVMNYLTNEVKQEGLTRNMGHFQDFWKWPVFHRVMFWIIPK